MNKHLLLATLQGVQFLRGFPRESLEQLAGVSQLIDYEDHEVIFRENEPADSVYLVVFGQVCLGCRRVLSVGAGELLGRSAILEVPHMTATARAVQTTRLVQIDAQGLRDLCERDPQFGYEFTRLALQVQSDRLMKAWKQMLDIYASMLPPVEEAGVKCQI
jgi:CRP/FNR family cyclic AMP-dependent transcriptional regulator